MIDARQWFHRLFARLLVVQYLSLVVEYLELKQTWLLHLDFTISHAGSRISQAGSRISQAGSRISGAEPYLLMLSYVDDIMAMTRLISTRLTCVCVCVCVCVAHLVQLQMITA